MKTDSSSRCSVSGGRHLAGVMIDKCNLQRSLLMPFSRCQQTIYFPKGESKTARERQTTHGAQRSETVPQSGTRHELGGTEDMPSCCRIVGR